MIGGLVLPTLAALGAGFMATAGHRRLGPPVRARLLAVVVLALGLAVTAAAATVAIGFITGIPSIAERLPWCGDVARTHDKVSPWLGLPAMVAVVVILVRAAVGYRRARRTLWGPPSAGPEVQVVADDRPEAYAVGGAPGHIVVSSGMLALLDGAEREVLLEHERAHLRHRHYRHVGAAVVVTTALPMLGFVTRRLRLAVECWADEEAASAVGDRSLVARTIIRAALARTDYATDATAMGAVGVPARVDALLLPRPSRGLAAAMVAVPAAALAVTGGSAVQLHHLLGFVSHVCRL